jgi:hypothetical protein
VHAGAWGSLWAQDTPLDSCASKAMIKVGGSYRMTTWTFYQSPSGVVGRQQWTIGGRSDRWSGYVRLTQFDKIMAVRQHTAPEAQTSDSVVYLNSCPKCTQHRVVFKTNNTDNPIKHAPWSSRGAKCPDKECGWRCKGLTLESSPAHISYIGKFGQSGVNHRFVFEADWPPVLLMPRGSDDMLPLPRISGFAPTCAE